LPFVQILQDAINVINLLNIPSLPAFHHLPALIEQHYSEYFLIILAFYFPVEYIVIEQRCLLWLITRNIDKVRKSSARQNQGAES
jgi:hypothetical protein